MAEVDPSLPAGEAGGYLERLVADGFKRELEQEENIVRSLPFFATSLGVLVAFMGLTRPMLPPLSWKWDVIVLYGLLVLTLTSLAALLAFLWRALRWHEHAAPVQTGELAGYASELHAYYRAAEAQRADTDPEVTVESAIVADLRALSIRQMSDAAATMRRDNLIRLRARARAFAALLAALSFAFCLMIAILMREALLGVGS